MLKIVEYVHEMLKNFNVRADTSVGFHNLIEKYERLQDFLKLAKKYSTQQDPQILAPYTYNDVQHAKHILKGSPLHL